MKYRLLAVAACAAAVALSTAPSAFADPTSTPLDCAHVVAVDGGYRLTADTSCALIWRESDKHFDLAGHTFSGSMVLHGDDLSLRNGTLRISGLNSASTGADLTLSRLNVRGGYFDFNSPGVVVTNSVLSSAFVDFYFQDGGTVRASVFDRSAILVQRSSDVRISNNVFTGQGSSVTVGNYIPGDTGQTNRTVVHGNVFVHGSSGIALRPRYAAPNNAEQIMDGTVVSANIVNGGPGSGISIDVVCRASEIDGPCPRAGDITVSGNVLLRNGAAPTVSGYDDGITARGYQGSTPDTSTLSSIVLAANKALRNSDLGFDVVGVTDGGGNIARSNGGPAQCAGVSC